MGVVTIEHIATEAMAYPDRVLEGCETGLALFSAGFCGRNDVIHLAIAGLRVTCVDNQPSLLDEMRRVYPDSWEYVEADAYAYASGSDRLWDVVTVDPWTNEFFKAASYVGEWCKLAARAVVLGCGTDQQFVLPDGWADTERVHRSDYAGGVYWAVLERT